MNAQAKIEKTEKEVSDHPVVDKAAEKLHETVDTTAAKAAVAEEKVRETATEAAAKLDETKSNAQAQGEQAVTTVKQYINEKPLASLGIAFTAGLVLSKLIQR